MGNKCVQAACSDNRKERVIVSSNEPVDREQYGSTFNESLVSSESSKPRTAAPVANFVTRRTSVAPSESLRHLLKLHAQSQLRFAGAATAVKLPRGASAELWIDIHMVDFVNEAATMWSLVENQCGARCADRQMSAGGRRFYEWESGDPPVVLSAVDYARQTLEYAAASIEDPRLFPTDERTPYPPDFLEHAKKICVDLVRIYAHVYHSHFSAIVALRCDQVVNDVFRRFVLFVLEFQLVDRLELQPLDELLRNLLRRPTPQFPQIHQDTTTDKKKNPSTPPTTRNSTTTHVVTGSNANHSPPDEDTHQDDNADSDDNTTAKPEPPDPAERTSSATLSGKIAANTASQ